MVVTFGVGGSVFLCVLWYFMMRHYNQMSAESQNAVMEESNPDSAEIEVADEKESAPPVADMV